MLHNFAQSNYGKISDEFRVAQFSNAKLTVAALTFGTFTTPIKQKTKFTRLYIPAVPIIVNLLWFDFCCVMFIHSNSKS